MTKKESTFQTNWRHSELLFSDKFLNKIKLSKTSYKLLGIFLVFENLNVADKLSNSQKTGKIQLTVATRKQAPKKFLPFFIFAPETKPTQGQSLMSL